MTFGIRETILIFSLAVCGLAVIKGSAAERWGGIFILISWSLILTEQFVRRSGAPSVIGVSAVGIAADIGLACGFLWLALRFSSLWLAAGLMLQAMQLALYGSLLASGSTRHNGYAVASNIESMLLLAVILGATIGSWRKRAEVSKALALEGAMASAQS